MRAVVLLAIVGGLGCRHAPQREERPPVSDALSVAVRKAAAGNGQLDLTAVVPVSWDRAYMFEAYTWPDYVTEKLGFYWPGGNNSASVLQDRYQLIVFVKGKSVVAWADLDTGEGRFDVDAGYVPRGDAKLEVKHTPWGVRILKHGMSPSVYRTVHFGPGGNIEQVDASPGPAAGAPDRKATN